MPINSQPAEAALSDKDLVAFVKNGDAGAFAALSDRYMPVLQGRAARYANIVGVDVEDFLQEGMLALFRAAKNYNTDVGVQFNTYAITCISNSMTTAIRRHMKNSNRNTTLYIDEIDDSQLQRQVSAHPQDGLVEDIYMDMEAMSYRVRQIETLLSDFERHVLKLYLRGLSYKQISDVLGATPKAVDNALQRVRRKLRPEG